MQTEQVNNEAGVIKFDELMIFRLESIKPDSRHFLFYSTKVTIIT